VTGISYKLAQQRFGLENTYNRHPETYRASSRRDRYEMRCILRTLEHIPAGSHVLDLPCGTGRLTSMLLERGFRVTGADSAPGMVAAARESFDARREQADLDVTFEVRDIMNTGHEDRAFDAVICNRLFHHFTESETRKAALAELYRISRGPVIISFFNSFSLSAMFRKLKNRLKNRQPVDRIPIPMRVFKAELQAAGFSVKKAYAVRWGRSPHWYVVAEPGHNKI
jgi:SAM-dependent methyltransferase